MITWTGLHDLLPYDPSAIPSSSITALRRSTIIPSFGAAFGAKNPPRQQSYRLQIETTLLRLYHQDPYHDDEPKDTFNIKGLPFRPDRQISPDPSHVILCSYIFVGATLHLRHPGLQPSTGNSISVRVSPDRRSRLLSSVRTVHFGCGSGETRVICCIAISRSFRTRNTADDTARLVIRVPAVSRAWTLLAGFTSHVASVIIFVAVPGFDVRKAGRSLVACRAAEKGIFKKIIQDVSQSHDGVHRRPHNILRIQPVQHSSISHRRKSVGFVPAAECTQSQDL